MSSKYQQTTGDLFYHMVARLLCGTIDVGCPIQTIKRSPTGIFLVYRWAITYRTITAMSLLVCKWSLFNFMRQIALF